jgi:alkylhydroperoxidase/carboxymuconolactone decarboxylase family protein YurZ
LLDRYNQGLENFRRITGQAGKSLTDTFDKTAPDLERYLMEFVFGDVYSRPALDVKQRQLVAISALAALGTCQPQLVAYQWCAECRLHRGRSCGNHTSDRDLCRVSRGH